MAGLKRRGLSLLEVIIAASLMLILLTAFYAIAEALKKSQVVSDSRLEARQNLRNAVKLTGFYFSQARFVYTLPNNASPALSINGYDCLLPQREPADPEVIHAGDSLAFAVPVDQTRLGDPPLDPKNPVAAAGPRIAGADGFCDNRYDIVVLTTRALDPADSYNPNARQLVLMRWDNVAPPTPFLPVTIDLESLGTPDNLKIFDAYLEPLADDGFRTDLLLEDTVPGAAVVHAQFSYVPHKANSAAQRESYNYTLNARNIF